MPIGPSGDSAEPPEGTGRPGKAAPPGVPESAPSGGRPPAWLTRSGRSPVVWAAAGLVVIGGAGALLATQEPGGSAQPRTQAALCGLVSCADVPSAAATSPPAPQPSTPVPSSPAPAGTHAPTPPPAPAPVRALDPTPAPAPPPVASAPPVPTPAPAPAPTWVPEPRPAWPPSPAHGQWPHSWPSWAQHGFHGHGRHSRWSPWG
jgi:hypothetical protein